MMKNTHQVLFEDSEVLVVSKAPKVHFDEVLPKDSPWQAVHRIDFETSGCLLFAAPQCFEAYRELFSKSSDESEGFKKIYLAGSSGRPGPFKLKSFMEGWILSRYRSSTKVQFKELDAPIERLSHRSKREAEHFVEGPIADSDARAQAARKLGFTGNIYQVDLVTGARHQIRAFFESRKAPLVGDVLYGATGNEDSRLELHAWKVEFKSPVSGKFYQFTAE